jgi:hypothetical protein
MLEDFERDLGPFLAAYQGTFEGLSRLPPKRKAMSAR